MLYAPVRQSTSALIMVGAMTLAVALLLAMLIGRHIAQPIARLVKYAQTVGHGEPVAPCTTGLRETDAVASSLFQASESLRRSMAERAQAAADLSASEERKQLLHQTVLTQENERKRIARELHDSLGQYLTRCSLGLAWSGEAVRPTPTRRQKWRSCAH